MRQNADRNNSEYGHLLSSEFKADKLFKLIFETTLLSHFKQPQFFQNIKFRAKLKISKFGTKNALFRCFWVAILIESHLKLAPPSW